MTVTSPCQRCWKTLVTLLFFGWWVRPVDRIHDFLLGCYLQLEAPFLPRSGCMDRHDAGSPPSGTPRPSPRLGTCGPGPRPHCPLRAGVCLLLVAPGYIFKLSGNLIFHANRGIPKVTPLGLSLLSQLLPPGERGFDFQVQGLLACWLTRQSLGSRGAAV